MKKELNIRVLVNHTHPNPQAAIDLIANILVNRLLKVENDGRDFDVPSGCAK